MNQLNLFDTEPMPEVKPVAIPVASPAEAPIYGSYNQTETSMPWRSFVCGHWTPYHEPKHPTDLVHVTGRCSRCRTGFLYQYPLAELGTEQIYCLELGGGWSVGHAILCGYCSTKVGEFLTKLLV